MYDPHSRQRYACPLYTIPFFFLFFSLNWNNFDFGSRTGKIRAQHARRRQTTRRPSEQIKAKILAPLATFAVNSRQVLLFTLRVLGVFAVRKIPAHL